MDLTIFIPTRGRTGSSLKTVNEMKKFSKRRAVIVCPKEEVLFYTRNAPHCDILESPIEGIGPKRQFIIEKCPTNGAVMIDDDMYFSYRPIPTEPRPLERVTDLEPMFQWISDTLDLGFPHGGISARQGNNNIPRSTLDCTRENGVHFLNKNLFLSEGLRFDVLPVMEDFFVSLTLLLRGYPNRVSYEYCWTQTSGNKGGCSLYRTAALQELAAIELGETFPEYVKVVEKESDSQAGVMAKRKDVTISWLKAWKDRDESFRLNKEYISGTPDLARR